MLTDATKSEAFRNAPEWKSPLLDFKLRVPTETAGLTLGETGEEPAYRSNSFSGHERNRLFLQGEDGYADLSLVSGVDCREDARSFAVLDYDGDGWVDIALMSPQAPRFRLFRNRMGDLGGGGRVLAIRLEGGNDGDAPGRASNRDAVGALVTAVTSKGEKIYRRSLGEGLASQNASPVRVTLAPGEELREIRVRWPSGSSTTIQPEAAATQLNVKESDAGSR